MKLLHKMLLLAFTLSCIISTDVQGQTQFKLAIGGSQSDRALGIAKCDSGGYAIAGHTYSYGAGNADMYVAKFDEEGMLLWSRTFGGNDNNFANSIALEDVKSAIKFHIESFGQDVIFNTSIVRADNSFYNIIFV